VTASVAAGVVLVVAAPSPGSALGLLRQLRQPAATAGGSTEALVALLSLVAWGLVLWLAVTALLTTAGRLPGLAGAVARTAVRRVAPAAVRRAVEVALGAGLVTGTCAAAPAAAAPPPSTSVVAAAAPAPAPSGARAAGLELDWPDTDGHEAGVEAGAVVAPVVVRPGDTLWRVAERTLHASTGAQPSAAQVARSWPRWWSANREVIGNDPDLILPGTALTAPEQVTGAPPR